MPIFSESGSEKMCGRKSIYWFIWLRSLLFFFSASKGLNTFLLLYNNCLKAATARPVICKCISTGIFSMRWHLKIPYNVMPCNTTCFTLSVQKTNLHKISICLSYLATLNLRCSNNIYLEMQEIHPRSKNTKKKKKNSASVRM